MVVSSEEGLKRTEKTFWRQAARQQEGWEKTLGRFLGNRAFACEADAREALKEATKRMPEWLEVEESALSSRPR